MCTGVPCGGCSVSVCKGEANTGVRCVQVYRVEDALCLYTLHGHSAAVSALTLHDVSDIFFVRLE